MGNSWSDLNKLDKSDDIGAYGNLCLMMILFMESSASLRCTVDDKIVLTLHFTASINK